MTVTELRRQADKIRANLEGLKSQLRTLEQSETPDDLSQAISQAAAVRTARELIAERESELAEQESAVAAAEAEEAREKAISQLVKRSAKAAERFNDSIMAVTGALAELHSVNDEAIALGLGCQFAAVGAVKAPPRVVPNPSGKGYFMGTI